MTIPEIRSISSRIERLVSSGRSLHLDLEAESRQRRADVVRDAGQDDGAIILDRLQFRGEPVEAAIELGDLRRPRLGQDARGATAAQAIDGTRQVRQRAVDQPADQQRADRGEGDADRADLEPVAVQLTFEPLRIDDQPVAVAGQVEADPQRLLAVDPARPPPSAARAPP